MILPFYKIFQWFLTAFCLTSKHLCVAYKVFFSDDLNFFFFVRTPVGCYSPTEPSPLSYQTICTESHYFMICLFFLTSGLSVWTQPQSSYLLLRISSDILFQEAFLDYAPRSWALLSCSSLYT